MKIQVITTNKLGSNYSCYKRIPYRIPNHLFLFITIIWSTHSCRGFTRWGTHVGLSGRPHHSSPHQHRSHSRSRHHSEKHAVSTWSGSHRENTLSGMEEWVYFLQSVRSLWEKGIKILCNSKKVSIRPNSFHTTLFNFHKNPMSWVCLMVILVHNFYEQHP